MTKRTLSKRCVVESSDDSSADVYNTNENPGKRRKLRVRNVLQKVSVYIGEKATLKHLIGKSSLPPIPCHQSTLAVRTLSTLVVPISCTLFVQTLSTIVVRTLCTLIVQILLSLALSIPMMMILIFLSPKMLLLTMKLLQSISIMK